MTRILHVVGEQRGCLTSVMVDQSKPKQGRDWSTSTIVLRIHKQSSFLTFSRKFELVNNLTLRLCSKFTNIGNNFLVMVCGDAVLLDFWCGFAEIFILFLFLFAVLQFYETKRFAVFRIQCGLRFSYAGAPVLCYSLRFLNVCLCCYAVFLTPAPPPNPYAPLQFRP